MAAPYPVLNLTHPPLPHFTLPLPQSKEKVLAKMVREGLTEKVEMDRIVKFKFENVGKLPPPVLQVRWGGVAVGGSEARACCCGLWHAGCALAPVATSGTARVARFC